MKTKKHSKKDIRIAVLEVQNDRLKEALASLLSARYWLDPATVPQAGIEAAPEQVVFNAAISYARIKKARQALE